MTGDPADVGHTGEPVLKVDVEDVLEGEGSPEEVATSGVDNTFWFSSRSRGLKKSRLTVRPSC